MTRLLARLRGDRAPTRRTFRPVTEDEIMAAAVDIAFATSLHDVTLEAVAHRVQASVADVQRREATDAALRTAVYHRIVAAELADTKRKVLAHPTVAAQLRALVAWLVEPANGDLTGVWLAGWVLGRQDETMAAVVRGEMEAWEVFLASIIRRGIREGVLEQADPDFVAAQLLGITDSINAYMLVGHGTDLDRLRLVNSVLERELGIDMTSAPATV